MRDTHFVSDFLLLLLLGLHDEGDVTEVVAVVALAQEDVGHEVGPGEVGGRGGGGVDRGVADGQTAQTWIVEQF